MELPILYEDADVVAVAKPVGLLTHADGRSSAGTAEDWFKEKYGAEGGYVHRLDRDTSGVLIFAKNKAAYDFLRKAFHDKDVQKTYLAFTYGTPKEKQGVIDFDIGRSRRDFRLRSAQPKAKGRLRESLTRYEVIGEAEGTDKGSARGYALLKVTPETGRTHQIRVHLKAIHHPIVGDSLYATGFFKSEMKPLGISRLGLHAYMLDLPLPSGGRALVTAPIPDDLAPAFAHFPGADSKFALR
jgi:23S rRNA pseudouridine1911/1915/1917 synthase